MASYYRDNDEMKEIQDRRVENSDRRDVISERGSGWDSIPN